MEHLLDVGTLEPCEPLELTLSATRGLSTGDYLKVVHRREPHPLFPLLEKTGFSWLCRPGGEAGFEIFIWHQGDMAAEGDVAKIS